VRSKQWHESPPQTAFTMTVNDVNTYEDLVRFLREWTNFGGDPPYDFIGAHHLFLALLTNLAKNHLAADLDSLAEFAPVIDEEQRNYLQQLMRLG